MIYMKAIKQKIFFKTDKIRWFILKWIGLKNHIEILHPNSISIFQQSKSINYENHFYVRVIYHAFDSSANGCPNPQTCGIS